MRFSQTQLVHDTGDLHFEVCSHLSMQGGSDTGEDQIRSVNSRQLRIRPRNHQLPCAERDHDTRKGDQDCSVDSRGHNATRYFHGYLPSSLPHTVRGAI